MDVTLKVILIGSSRVGKSTLLYKMINRDSFYQNMPSTIGVDFGVIHDTNVKIQFWDTAGQERFSSIVNIYFKNVNFILLVYDLNNSSNEENIMYWLKLSKEKTNNSPIFIIGNKLDSEKIYPFNITDDIINEYNIIGHMKISCKNNFDYVYVRDYLIEYGKTKYQIINKKNIKINSDKLKKERYKCCTII